MGCLTKAFFSAATLWTAFTTPALTVSIVDKPLDPSGYGYTSHEGQQLMFDSFSVSGGGMINQFVWYGQFSDGLVANDQSSASFNVFLFHSDPEEEITTPEGTITAGVPSTPAFFAARDQNVSGLGTGYADPLHGGDIKKWTLDVSTIYLEPGQYWIVVAACAAEQGFYLWNHSAGTLDGVDVSGNVSASNEPRVWASSSVPERESMAFSLNYVAVPETANTMFLLSTAVAALAIVRRRI